MKVFTLSLRAGVCTVLTVYYYTATSGQRPYIANDIRHFVYTYKYRLAVGKRLFIGRDGFYLFICFVLFLFLVICLLLEIAQPRF